MNDEEDSNWIERPHWPQRYKPDFTASFELSPTEFAQRLEKTTCYERAMDDPEDSTPPEDRNATINRRRWEKGYDLTLNQNSGVQLLETRGTWMRTGSGQSINFLFARLRLRQGESGGLILTVSFLRSYGSHLFFWGPLSLITVVFSKAWLTAGSGPEAGLDRFIFPLVLLTTSPFFTLIYFIQVPREYRALNAFVMGLVAESGGRVETSAGLHGLT